MTAHSDLERQAMQQMFRLIGSAQDALVEADAAAIGGSYVMASRLLYQAAVDATMAWQAAEDLAGVA